MSITFGDAATASNIPFAYAALYAADCDYPCPADVAARWPDSRKHWITFGGLRSCQLADFEPGTEVYEDPKRLYTWARVRHAKKERFIVYCDLVTVAKAQQALEDLSGDAYWWLAWYTADGKPSTPDDISRELATNYGATVDAGKVWAQQYASNDYYDSDSLFGSW
jgi:hypothetical protein